MTNQSPDRHGGPDREYFAAALADPDDPRARRRQRAKWETERRELVDQYVAKNPGLTYRDFHDVPVDQFAAHASALIEQKRRAAASVLGVTVDEVDEIKAQREGRSPTP